MQQLAYTVPLAADGQRLGVFLRSQGISAGLIKAVKYRGSGFFADGVPVFTNAVLRPGQQITFTLPPELPTTVAAQPVPFGIVFEDDYAAVLDKPAALAVHPTLNHPDGTLANGWLYHLQSKGQTGVFRPINRIDKNTSGLVLCAKNSFAAPLLAGNVQKCYLALVQGVLPQSEGCIDAPIARQGASIIGRCVAADGKPSITRYRVLGTGGGHSLVACWPVTGRTHQIRVHMAHTGHPLAGDTLYGGATALLPRHALHCGALRFTHPVTRQILALQSQLPDDMAAACCACKLAVPADFTALLP